MSSTQSSINNSGFTVPKTFYGINKVLKPMKEVIFNPYNPEHLAAAKEVLLRREEDINSLIPIKENTPNPSKMYSGLKFKLEPGHVSVPSMMNYKILKMVFEG